MDVGMMQQVLTPSVEHGKEANLCTEVLGVSCYLQ
jgi:hypothetical protein